MGKNAQFFMTMILGGIVFLLPLVFITMILGKAFQLMMVVAKPVDKIIPLDSVGNIAFVNIVAALAILLSCFLAGMAARSGWGRGVSEAADEKLRLFIPGYALMREKVTSVVGDQEQQSTLTPVLVQFDDQSQIAFEIERSQDGLVTVFLPGAPDPWSGSAVFVTADRVAPIDTEVNAALRTFKKIGLGAVDALGPVRLEFPTPTSG